MSIPTVNECLADAAIHLGDTAQDQFTNAVLLPFFGIAFREVYDMLERYRLPKGERWVYVRLPANSNILSLTQAGISDIGFPTEVWEAPLANYATVTVVSNTTPVVVTIASNPGFITGNKLELSGVVGPVGVNDSWIVTVSGTNVTLNNSVAGGAYSSGGTLMDNSTDYVRMISTEALPQYSPGATLRWWKWADDRFYFIGSNRDNVLKIVYSSSGTAPTSGSTAIDNSRNFFGLRTAALAADAYDRPQQANMLRIQAFGPSQMKEDLAGAFGGLLRPMLLEKQKRPSISNPFRPRRNSLTRILW